MNAVLAPVWKVDFIKSYPKIHCIAEGPKNLLLLCWSSSSLNAALAPLWKDDFMKSYPEIHCIAEGPKNLHFYAGLVWMLF